MDKKSPKSTAFVVPPELDGAALDAALRQALEISWGKARDLIQKGKIAVDGRVLTSPVHRVRQGVTLTVNEAAPRPRTIANALLEGAIVFVDPHLVVVDKPPGIPTIPFDPAGMSASIGRGARDHDEPPALDERVRIALARREKQHGRSGPPPEIGVVHRLDKETSGLLVFTRSWAAKKALLQAFRFHHVHRLYLALVHGVPKNTTITSHFVPDRGDGLRGSVEHRRGRKHAIGNEKTQRAVTHVEVVLAIEGEGFRCALVKCRLETGRTHQIRIHLAEAGHPLLGERVYVRDYQGPVVDAPRVMLHAAELGFTHPVTERELRWTSPLPEDMATVLTALRGSAAG